MRDYTQRYAGIHPVHVRESTQGSRKLSTGCIGDLCGKAPSRQIVKNRAQSIPHVRESTQTGTGAVADTSNALVERKGAQQLELFEIEEIARPDYNIGKYATVLFASPHVRNLDKTYRIEWETTDPHKNRQAVAAIEIKPLQAQIRPTTTSFKVFMGILQLWRAQGSKASGEVYFSDRQLADACGWYWTGRIAKRIREHLDVLQGTSINWEFSFVQDDSLERLVNKMHLLEEVTYLERRLAYEEERFSGNHTARINPNLVQNMLANRVRPINFESIRQIRSDASTRLYVMLDMYLAKKRNWERRSKGLLMDDLGYEGTRYKNRGERKRTLAKLIKDLDGKELASGKLELELAETADGTDWKLVARKIQRIQRARKGLKRVLDDEAATLLAEDLLSRFEGVPKAGAPKRQFMIFLCVYYPADMLRDAISRAKADYLGNVRKSVGAIFRYELEQAVKQRADLVWYKDTK